MIRTPNNQNGSVMVAIIITLPFILLILALYMQLTVNSFTISKRDQSRTHAQLATDAGIDAAMEQINTTPGWTTSGGQVEVHNDGQYRTTYEVTLSDVDDDNKTLRSIGRTYRPASASSPSETVTIDVGLRAVKSGEYSVVSGVGGLIMSNNAKILGGDVFINGTISLSNSAQIGLTTSPVNVEVAHQSCPNPPNATYPRVCNSGENGQPITFANSSRIYGDVRANNQTSGANMSNPGLTASSGVTAQPLPPHDRAGMKATINAADAANAPDAMTGAAAGCSSGTKIWPANLKINGNVSITNSCKVTVQGNVWITGSLSMSNSSEMIVSNTLGTTRPVVMVDGASATFTNSSLLRSNNQSTGFLIINYRSDAACSPDCADVTGVDLFNSRNDERISLSNSSAGPNTIFYARWTKVRVDNSGQIGALVGQTVDISNNGTITFGTSTGTGTVFWVIDSYNRVF